MVLRTRFRKTSRKGRWIVPCLAAVFLGYFGFHSVNGTLGLNAKMKLEIRRAELAQELEVLERQRQVLEKKVQLLQNGTLEKDMLDERARRLLEVTRPDEVVIRHAWN